MQVVILVLFTFHPTTNEVASMIRELVNGASHQILTSWWNYAHVTSGSFGG